MSLLIKIIKLILYILSVYNWVYHLCLVPQTSLENLYQFIFKRLLVDLVRIPFEDEEIREGLLILRDEYERERMENEYPAGNVRTFTTTLRFCL